MKDFVVWLLVGLGLMILEVMAPGVFLVWLGIAGIGTGLVAWVWPSGFATQVVVFAVLAGLSVAAALRVRTGRRDGVMNTQEGGLIGRPAVALSFAGADGRVRIGDSDWAARLADGAPPPDPGARLTVVAVHGTVVVVRAA